MTWFKLQIVHWTGFLSFAFQGKLNTFLLQRRWTLFSIPQNTSRVQRKCILIRLQTQLHMLPKRYKVLIELPSQSTLSQAQTRPVIGYQRKVLSEYVSHWPKLAAADNSTDVMLFSDTPWACSPEISISAMFSPAWEKGSDWAQLCNDCADTTMLNRFYFYEAHYIKALDCLCVQQPCPVSSQHCCIVDMMQP